MSHLRLVEDGKPASGADEMAEWLWSYVERALRGELRSVAIAVVTDDGAIGTAWLAVDRSSLQQLAAIGVLQHRLARYVNGEPEP